MSQIRKISKCLGCMNDIVYTDQVCPHCGAVSDKIVNDATALRCGYILYGRYLIGKVLGSGGFGITYLGYDLTLNLKVAIKEFFPKNMATRQGTTSATVLWNATHVRTTQKQKGCDAFLAEARKMAKMNEISSIVRVRDTFSANETAYIVMDFVEGITLKDKVKKEGIMSYKKCLELLYPIMDGLAEAHKQGLIHRDISPDNIMIRKDGSVRLLDFGAARDYSSVYDDDDFIVHKKGFSPLEQYSEDGNIGPWTDVYAMCATIYYCITGKVIPSSMDRDIKSKVEFPVNIQKKIPKNIINGLQQGLMLMDRQRIQDMVSLKKKLNISKVRKVLPYAAGIVAVAGLAVAGIKIVDMTKLRVEQYGHHNNANFVNGNISLEISDRYYYRVSADSDLYFYDTEGSSEYFECIFYESEFLSLSDDSVYFISDIDGQSKIYRMNHDATDIQEFYSHEDKAIDYLQYVKLSDNEEYLYFTIENDEKNLEYELWRYNLHTNLPECVLSEVYWYNLYDDSLYSTYVEVTENDFKIHLRKSGLDGRNIKALDSEKRYAGGFVVDDTMLMIDYDTYALIPLDLNGNEKNTKDELMKLNCDPNYAVGYNGNWLYYVNSADGGLHQVRTDGSGDRLIIKDRKPIVLYGDNDNIFYIHKGEDEYGTYYQPYWAIFDGSEESDVSIVSGELLLPVTKPTNFEYEEGNEGIVITKYIGEETEVKIPGFINEKPVVEIGEDAFRESAIEKVCIPITVKTIGKGAFYQCESLNEVGLPEGLEKISEGAFGACTSLKKIRLPESLKSIENIAFGESSLSAVYVGSNLEKIGDGCFVSKDEDGLKEIKISPNNSNYTVQNGVLFSRDMRTLIACPSSFSGTYQIPDGVYKIETYAFAYCRNLTNVEIPSSVSRIETGAFIKCDNLSKISVKETCYVDNNLGNENIQVERYPLE